MDSRVISSATGPKAARGYTVHCLVIDECAHCEHWDEFFASVYPTISEFKGSKDYHVFNSFWFKPFL